MKLSLNNTRKCLNLLFLLEQQKNYRDSKNLTHKLWRGPTTWNDMLENVLSDTVNWQTRKWSNFIKSQALAWTITSSSRQNSNQLENCQKFAHKLSGNACTWHDLDDLTSCAQSISLGDQSQNGLRHVTDAWQGCFLTFIIQTISDNIVMWETWHNIADWVYFKTQTLLEILRTQKSTLGGVLCMFGTRTFVSQSVGCARNKLLSRTVPQSLRSFLWMLDNVWKETCS